MAGGLRVAQRHLIGGIGMTSQRTRDRLVARLREEGIVDPAVLDVIRRTPRHLFVEEALASRAYEDTALPIGHRQTISQPYIVALMTQALLKDGIPASVLEVGTGSGYQAALLAQLVQRVYTVERIPELSMQARERIRDLGLHNVRYHISDGTWGWERYAPYEAIMVTAAPEEVPSALLEQLAQGGRMVVPVGSSRGVQKLQLITRTPECFQQKTLETVTFVPLIRDLVPR